MSEICIRKAVYSDCLRLLELIKELALYEKSPDEVSVSLAHFQESGFGKNPLWWAFVAEVDGVVRGFALYYIRYSTWKGQRMYLEDFYVEPSMRRQGTGDLLFKKLIEEGKKQNLNGMVWQVLAWNEPALNFYRKHKTSFDDQWVNCSLDFE
jgi:GNAT superfamily N-acetyltransferase